MIETEIKLRWNGDAPSAREHIEAHGFRAIGLRLLEADQLFDRALIESEDSGELRAKGQVLRLRLSDGIATVTYKGPVAASGPYKSREEIEFVVDDPGALEIVLARLGYRRAFRYEKYRTKFSNVSESRGEEQGIVTLDETPIGVFMELEGPEYWITSTAAKLGYTASQYISASYAALYREFCVANQNIAKNMVFSQEG
jgi:adenylate cyclase, class 2